MPKPAPTAEPAPRHPVKEDASFPRVKNGRNPANPFGVEAPGLENSKETVPRDGVKGFAKIQFQGNRGNFPFVTASKEVSGVDIVLGDVPAMDEPGLVAIHKRSNVRSDAVCHHFGEELHGTVLKRNRAESIGGACSFFFWQEHKMGTVESIKVQRAIMEGSKEVALLRCCYIDKPFIRTE